MPRPAKHPYPLPPMQHAQHPSPIDAHIRFHGHVQGVGFRVTTSRLADQHRITGWVANQPDGTVQLLAQGSAESIQALLEAIHAAYPRHITREDRTDYPAAAPFNQFNITG